MFDTIISLWYNLEYINGNFIVSEKGDATVNIAFVACSIFLIIILAGCIVITTKAKTELSFHISVMFAMAICTVLFYSVSLVTPKVLMGLSMYGLYYAGFYWFVIFMLNYAVLLTEYKPQTGYYGIIAVVIGVADTIALILNAVNQFMFTLEASYNKAGGFYCWLVHYKTPNYIHETLCYTVILFTLMILGGKASKSPRMYRRKYISILVAYSSIVFLKILMYVFGWELDYSLLLYAFPGITICYFTIFSIPKELVQNVLYSVSENTSSSIVCFDNRNRCIYANDGACRFIGAKKNELPVFERHFAQYINQYNENNSDYEVLETEHEIDSKLRNVSVEFQAMRDKKNNYLGCFFKMEDRTEEVQRFRMEKYRATHDSLTGVLNRVAFIEEATKVLEDNPDKEFYVVVSNVKEFKFVNDLFGTKMGDMILCKEADVLKKLCENTGVVAGRMAGDRFALLMPVEYYDEKMAIKSARDIELIMKVYDYKLRICFGVYRVDDNSENIQTMYDKACMVIDKTKDDYLKTLSYYDTSIMKKALREKNIVSEFDKAIRDGQFKMYLQAQVDNEDKLIGAEALVRWEHPKHGLIFPGDFIDILERTGHIYKLDTYIWEQAAQKLSDWKQKGITDKYISVNISAKDFYYIDLYRKFTELTNKYSINPFDLKLEITETVLMHDLELHLGVLDKLREFGFQIGVDDFGSGYSSLNMLKDIKADVLKIDMVFLRETENHVRSRIILDSIIGMTKELGMQVLTEGVEKEEQIKLLKEMGCDYFQGYYYSKPVSIEEFEDKYFYNAGDY